MLPHKTDAAVLKPAAAKSPSPPNRPPRNRWPRSPLPKNPRRKSRSRKRRSRPRRKSRAEEVAVRLSTDVHRSAPFWCALCDFTTFDSALLFADAPATPRARLTPSRSPPQLSSQSDSRNPSALRQSAGPANPRAAGARAGRSSAGDFAWTCRSYRARAWSKIHPARAHQPAKALRRCCWRRTPRPATSVEDDLRAMWDADVREGRIRWPRFIRHESGNLGNGQRLRRCASSTQKSTAKSSSPRSHG